MSVTLGSNHMFLYPEAMVEAKTHLSTLRELASTDLVKALDCWLWRGETAREEIRFLRESGKTINYNIGDRFGEDIALPASRDVKERERAYSLMMREIEYALELNSKKIVFGSGPDDPSDREGAKERFASLILRVASQLPADVELSFEPTDRDIHKKFLFGPLDETLDFIKLIQNNGFAHIGLLLDMCHVPLIYETLESALEKGADLLNHIHLGNCFIKNPSHPLYGDRHAPWNHPEGEYTEADGIRFIRMLRDVGYFAHKNATVSFEIRPYEGMTAMESLVRFVSVWNEAVQF